MRASALEDMRVGDREIQTILSLYYKVWKITVVSEAATALCRTFSK